MEFSKMSFNPQVHRFERNGEGMNLTINVDFATPEYFRSVALKLREGLEREQKQERARQKKIAASVQPPQANRRKSSKAKTAPPDDSDTEKQAKARAGEMYDDFELKARLLEVQRDVYAIFLAGSPDAPVLMEWELTRDGNPVPISVEEIKKLPPKIVKELYDFCIKASRSNFPKEQVEGTTGSSPTT